MSREWCDFEFESQRGKTGEDFEKTYAGRVWEFG